MSTLLTVKQVKSLTVGFAFPETYDMSRAEEIKVYLGKNVYPHTIDGRVVKCQIKSDDTAVMYGANRLSFWLDDSIIGVYPVYCGNIIFEYTNAIEHNESVNTGFDLIVNLSISETAITVGDILYNYVKGDKGDPFLYSDFTLEQIEALKVKGDAFEYSDFTPEQIALLQKPASDIATTVSNAEQLRATAETNRNNAEGLRLSAETTRGENEADRIEAEGLRAGAETSRQTAEGLRQQAELNRQTNTATAIQNAENAATGANNAAGLANEKAGLADTAKALALEVANNPDKVVADYWWKWNTTAKAYENTGIKAKGEPGTTAVVRQTTGTSETDVMSQKAVTGIQDELTNAKSAMQYISPISLSDASAAIYLVNAANLTAAYYPIAGYSSKLLAVNPRDKFRFKAVYGGVSMAVIIFWDSAGNKISSLYNGSTQLSGTTIETDVIVPAGVSQMTFTTNTTGNVYYLSKYSFYDINGIATNSELAKKTTEKVDEFSFYKNIYDYASVGVVAGVIQTNGSLHTTGFSTGLIPVKPNHFYFLSNRNVNAIKSIRCVASDKLTISKVRVASTGAEPVAARYYYLPEEDDINYALDGQFKTSPTAAYIQITLTAIDASVIGENYKIMLEDVGEVYDAGFIPSAYVSHKINLRDNYLEYPVRPLYDRVTNDTIKVLLIGSSHGMNTIGQFPILAHNSGIDVICANAYQGSLSIQQIADYCNSGTVFSGWYKKFYDGIWTASAAKTILQMLQDEQWNFISLQRSASEDMTWTEEQDTAFQTILAFITENCDYTPTIVFNSGFADTYSIATRAAQQADTATIWSTANQVKTKYGIEIIPMATIMQQVRNNDTLAGLGSYANKMLSCDDQHLDQGIGMYVSGCICFNFFLKHLRKSILSCKYLPTVADMTPFWYEVAKFTAIDEQYAKEIRRIVNLNS